MSRLLVGSSNSRTGVCWARARAMETFCRSPPDNSLTLREAKSSSDMVCSTSCTIFRSFSVISHRINGFLPSRTASKTLESANWQFWETYPIRFASSLPERLSTSWSPTRTFPDWGLIMRLMHLSMVDFPTPFMPRMATHSPGFARKDTPLTTSWEP